MRSQVLNRVPSALLALTLALAGCAQVPASDQASADGSSAGKAPLTKGAAKKPAKSAAKPVRRAQTPKRNGAVNNKSGAPAGAHLTYYGGRVVSNMQVVEVLWGAGNYLPQVKNTASPSIATFYQGILNSSYVDMFAQYDTTVGGGTNQHIGHGSFLQQVTITPSTSGSSIDDTAIQSELAAQISAGKLPAPTTDAAGNNNTYYAIFFPPGLTITQGGSSSCVSGGFCAYHGTVASANGHEIYYGVHPDMQAGSGCDTGCGSASNPFDNYTSVASHEMSETITDGEVGLATTNGPPLAWYDNTNGEIGDICNAIQGPVTGGDGVTYTVQAEFSNADNDCVYQSGNGNPTADFSLSASPASQTVAAGASTSFTVTSAASGGFSGKIQLSVSGLPSGATSSVTGDPSNGGATLAVATAATAAAGTYPLTITGVSGSLTHTTSVTLVITGGSTGTPDFSLSADAAVTVAAGQSGSVNVSTSGSGGFAADVALSVSGAPSGVTASFNPAAISGGTGSSSLSLAVDPSAAAGTATLVVTGTSGSLSHSANVALTITAAAGNADFALAVSPASVSVAAGSSAIASATVTGSGGFSDDVSLSASGAPSGVTVTFDTDTVVGGSGSANLTIAADASAAAGSFAITVTGTTASGLSHSASLSVAVSGGGSQPPPGTVFFDDVENGNIGWIAYADNPDDPTWEIEETPAAHSGTHRWRSNPGRNYANNTNSVLISPSIDLSSYSSATLAFFYKFHTEQDFDYFYVWASGDDGQTWDPIAQGTGASSGWNGWAPQASVDLSYYAGSGAVRIAFSIQSDESVTDWGAAVDDIGVTVQ